jgi:hypothetical protein
MTFTFGLETELDCEPEVVSTVAPLVEPEFEVWAKAAPHRMVNAEAAKRNDLM